MRTLGTGTATATTAPVSTPGWLVEIVLNDPAHSNPSELICSLAGGFTFATRPFAAADIQFTSMEWAQGGSSQATMVLGDPDLVYWAYAGNGAFRDAVVYVWQVYAEAPGEATPLLLGRIGGIKKGAAWLEISIMRDSSLMASPRRRVQSIIPAKFLLPPGKRIFAGGLWMLLER